MFHDAGDILKALVCCMDEEHEKCEKCPYYDDRRCEYNLKDDAHNMLITYIRENISLKKEAKAWKDHLDNWGRDSVYG